MSIRSRKLDAGMIDAGLLVLALAVFVCQARGATLPSSRSWVGTWTTSQLIAEGEDAVPVENLRDATLRQLVHLSSGGSAVRIRVSNVFGTSPLHVTALHVARPVSMASSRIEPGSDRALTFNERANVLIPAGADYLSDAIEYPVAPLSNLAITLQIEAAPGQETGHPGAHTVSYLAAGLPAASPHLAQATSLEHWYFLSGVEVSAASKAAAIVCFGDSITDGHGATTNGNDRWTDVLAAHLQGSASGKHLAVLNEGIGGNRLLTDGFGPNALARFDRDVLAQAGVRYLIVLEGINDIGTLTRSGPATDAQHEELVRRMIGAYRQIVARAHAHGIKVYAGTLLPFMGSTYYHPDASNERDRQAINAWIRAAGHFDAVIDFDQVTADPAHPDQIRSDFDIGDHLHPSPAGYRAMAEAIPLTLFRR